ncbi:hypothetical protein VB713_17570 [Anabaena cylindrica UHCC 0172]|nr:hypothetical protein [Anabaena cylindrica UHCC 0172]
MSLLAGQKGVCPQDHKPIQCCPQLEMMSRDDPTTQWRERQALKVKNLQFIVSTTFLE